LTHKRHWKNTLYSCWLRAAYPVTVSGADQVLLQQLRNNGGAALLETFRPRREGYRHVGYLKQDRQEKFDHKRGWFETAWRLVSEAGADLIQPWSDTKAEARKTADTVGICLVGVLQ
jgi:hypothetical protein